MTTSPPVGESGTEHVAWRNRKDVVSHNVLVAVDFKINFIYCLGGSEGSVHDGKVMTDAIARGFGLPRPCSFLADAGYLFCGGLCLPPFKEARYHLQEWDRAEKHNQLPKNAQESFNRGHSSLRNVVERILGVLKKRFRILNQPHENYPLEFQVKFAYICVA